MLSCLLYISLLFFSFIVCILSGCVVCCMSLLPYGVINDNNNNTLKTYVAALPCETEPSLITIVCIGLYTHSCDSRTELCIVYIVALILTSYFMLF